MLYELVNSFMIYLLCLAGIRIAELVIQPSLHIDSICFPLLWGRQ